MAYIVKHNDNTYSSVSEASRKTGFSGASIKAQADLGINGWRLVRSHGDYARAKREELTRQLPNVDLQPFNDRVRDLTEQVDTLAKELAALRADNARLNNDLSALIEIILGANVDDLTSKIQAFRPPRGYQYELVGAGE